MYYNIFILSIAIGFYLAYLYGRKTTEFKWSEYLATLILPFLALGFLIWQEGVNILWYFIVCAFAGNLAEHLGGFSLHKILGHHLWTYHRLSWGGYTSILSWPYWGMIGILFLSIYKTISQ